MNRPFAALALSLAALAISPTVSAEEERGAHWHVAGSNDQAFMTVNVHDAQKIDDGTIVVSSAMYFATPQSLGSETVDFAVSVEQMDCSKRYRYRTVAAEGFAAQVGPPVFKIKDVTADWRTAVAQTLAGNRWEMVCEGIPDRTALYGVETHEDVLGKYRDSMQGESGMALPPEAEQILRDLSI